MMNGNLLGTTKRLKSLTDASNKMSKSAPNDSTRINLTDSKDSISLKIRKAKTDSIEGPISYDIQNRPEISNLIDIYSGLSGLSVEEIVKRFENNNSTRKFKEELVEVVVDRIVPIGNRINELLKEGDNSVEEILKEGAMQANEIAEKTIRDVRSLVGFI